MAVPLQSGLGIQIQYGVPSPAGISTGSLALLLFFGVGVLPYLLGGVVISRVRNQVCRFRMPCPFA